MSLKSLLCGKCVQARSFPVKGVLSMRPDALVFIILLMLIIVVGVGGFYFSERNNRDTKIIVAAVAMCSIIILSFEFVSGSVFAISGNLPPISATSTPSSVIHPNISLPCGDCEQPNVTVKLI